MNLTADECRRMYDDVGLIRRAVIGEKDSGHVGLVNQMTNLQGWRRKMDLRVSVISLSISGIFWLIFHIFGKP